MQATIIEKPHLKKDLESGAIINSDKSGYLQARARKKALAESKKKIDSLEERVSKLELALTNLLNK